MRDGDAAAAEELFTRHHAKLIAYARSLGHPNDADDFVQAGFVALLTTARLDDPAFEIRRYLFKVVRYRAVKQSLRHAREPGLEDAATVADDEACSQLDRLIVQHAIERAAAIIDACCTPAEQTVLAMTHAGHSTAEIAAALETTVGNVRVIRHRGLAKLRGAFESEEKA